MNEDILVKKKIIFKESKTDEDEESDKADLDPDDDYEMSGEGEDDEQTILEQEMTEANMDHKKEIAELEAESKPFRVFYMSFNCSLCEFLSC